MELQESLLKEAQTSNRFAGVVKKITRRAVQGEDPEMSDIAALLKAMYRNQQITLQARLDETRNIVSARDDGSSIP